MDQQERELLFRIDERTEAIDKKVDVIGGRVSNNEDDIDELQESVRRNTTILGGLGTGITAAVLWIADKITRIV